MCGRAPVGRQCLLLGWEAQDRGLAVASAGSALRRRPPGRQIRAQEIGTMASTAPWLWRLRLDTPRQTAGWHSFRMPPNLRPNSRAPQGRCLQSLRVAAILPLPLLPRHRTFVLDPAGHAVPAPVTNLRPRLWPPASWRMPGDCAGLFPRPGGLVPPPTGPAIRRQTSGLCSRCWDDPPPSGLLLPALVVRTPIRCLNPSPANLPECLFWQLSACQSASDRRPANRRRYGLRYGQLGRPRLVRWVL